jgi:putative endonuclease
MVKQMFYVYILKSLKDEKLYVGYSTNLKQRFKEHQIGKVNSTSHRRPLELIYYEAYKNEDDAKDREKSFKHSGSVYNGLVKRIKRSKGL